MLHNGSVPLRWNTWAAVQAVQLDYEKTPKERPVRLAGPAPVVGEPVRIGHVRRRDRMPHHTRGGLGATCEGQGRAVEGEAGTPDEDRLSQCAPGRAPTRRSNRPRSIPRHRLGAPVRIICADSRSISANAAAAVGCSLISVASRALSSPHGCTTRYALFVFTTALRTRS